MCQALLYDANVCIFHGDFSFFFCQLGVCKNTRQWTTANRQCLMYSFSAGFSACASFSLSSLALFHSGETCLCYKHWLSWLAIITGIIQDWFSLLAAALKYDFLYIWAWIIEQFELHSRLNSFWEAPEVCLKALIYKNNASNAHIFHQCILIKNVHLYSF